MEAQIVALGGGGFWMEESPLLDDFLLRTVASPRPKVCFVGTASGDAESYIRRFYQHFASRECQLSHFPVFSTPPGTARQHLLAQDLIYVGGGATLNMLALWRLHGIDAVLHEAWQQGIVLCGPSAGAMCWFEAGVTASLGDGMTPFREGLGFLRGSFCPHYGDDEARTAAYRDLVREGFPAGLGVSDGAAVRFSGGEIAEVVAAHDGATAYRVSVRDGALVESQLPATPLS
jgi:dipeptidase E